ALIATGRVQRWLRPCRFSEGVPRHARARSWRTMGAGTRMSLVGLMLGALLTTALLAVLVGRLVVRRLGVAWLDRTHPDVLPLQAAIGTAAMTLAAATASHIGLGQRR